MSTDELLAIFDSQGRPLGAKPRSQVHRDGDWHWLVFVWAARQDGGGRLCVLLQVRSRPGDPYLGSADAPAGGHVTGAENHCQGAQREFAEEVGIAITAQDLVYLGQGRLENPAGICRRVIEHFYLCTRPVLLEEVRFNEEAGGFVEVELEEFCALLESRREAVTGLGRFAHRDQIHAVELTRRALAAYPEEILQEFRRSMQAIRAYLREGQVDEGIFRLHP